MNIVTKANRPFTLLVIPLFVFVAFIVFVASLIFTFTAVETIKSTVSVLHLEIAERTRAIILKSVNERIDEQRQLGRSIVRGQEKTSELLATFLHDNPQFANVALVNKKGEEVARLDRYRVVSSAELKSYGTESFPAMTPGQFFVSPIFFSNLGEPLVTITTPIISLLGEFDGVVTAELSLKFIWSLVEEINIGKNGKVYVVDDRGTLIADPDSSLVLANTNLLSRPIVSRLITEKKIIDGLKTKDQYTNLGITMFTTGIWVNNFNWGIITEEPLEDAFFASRRVLVVGMGLSVVFTVLFFLLVFSFRRLLLSNQFLEVERQRVAEQSKKLGENVFLLNKLNKELNNNATLLHRREIELTQSNTKLQELDKVKSEFISVAAHQLRTPLSAIKWTLSILLEESGSHMTAQEHSLILKAEESNERVINLINEMLVVSRIESGKMKYDPIIGHVEDVIESVILDFAGQAHVRNITLTFKKNTQQFYVRLDTEKIRAVIQNLIENSIRYTKDGGTITIHTRIEKGAEVVTIADNGIGIPERQQSTIFNKFFRADNAVKAQTEGTGLGLFIAKSIVEWHGGRLWFESKEGQGTTFSFTLPLAGAENRDA